MARTTTTERASRRGVHAVVQIVTDPDASPADVHAAIYEAAMAAIRRYPDPSLRPLPVALPAAVL